jgi:hypothetical protein
MMFTRKLADTVPQESPRYLLHKLLSEYQDPRPLKNVHGSEVTKDDGICARMYALADLTGMEQTAEWLTTSQAVTFELGHLLEARIINWFADIGMARSNWRCMACGSAVEFCVRPLDCPKCGNTHFKPENFRVVSKKTGVSCGLDLLLDFPHLPKLKIVEIKTIDKDEFAKLAAPLAEHRQRTNLYMRVASESDDPRAKKLDMTEAFVLYVSKGGFGVKDPVIKTWGLHDGFSPFKEFVIKRRDADTEDMLIAPREVLAFRQGKVGVPHAVCATPLVERAGKCALRKICFSGKFPAGVKP